MNNKKNIPSAKKAPYRKINKKKRSPRFLAGLFFFVIFYVIFMIIFGVLLFLGISMRPRDKSEIKNSEIKIVYEKLDEKTGKAEPIEEVLKNEQVNFENSLYIPITALESLKADISIAGDSTKTLTIILNAVNEAATFTINSDKVKVNGSDITMKSKTFMKNNVLYIPIDFYQTQVNGIEIVKEKNTYTLKKTGTEPISFVNKPADVTPPIVENDNFKDLPIKFKSDLSSYEQYMNPTNRDDYLFVVNLNNLLSKDFVPEDLRDVKYTKPGRDAQQMSLNAQMSADAMMIEARANGFKDIWVTSAYRSYKTQTWLYQNEIDGLRAKFGNAAEEEAKKSVNPPGASEHQSGLTADIHNLSTASLKFSGTPQAEWLAENAQYFGFILRYPEDKTEQTGIMFEPWHFRYVGRYHAMQMKKLGLCLEEYVKHLEE